MRKLILNKLNYGSGGIGSAGHIAMESFQAATNTSMIHIPYKGSGPAITDLISGQIQAMLMTIAAIKPYIDAGQVRALATSGENRSAALPTLPTLSEAGLKNFSYAPWYGVFVPAKTPIATINQLHDAFNLSIQNPVNKTKLAQLGLETKPLTKSEFQDIFYSDLNRWGQIIRKLNIKN
jgi:tripartite-type tricarboxylate transporter receptor subunit TctC